MTLDSAQTPASATRRALRPDALGTRHVVAAGHPLAAQAALGVLEAGGNAADAGVAAGLCLGVVHPEMVSVAGVAPIILFGLSPQQAVEAPRFATQSFPESFWPHRYFPGRLALEGRFPESTATELAGRGHQVARWADWEWRAGGVCLARMDAAGVRWGAADPRPDAMAVAW